MICYVKRKAKNGLAIEKFTNNNLIGEPNVKKSVKTYFINDLPISLT